MDKLKFWERTGYALFGVAACFGIWVIGNAFDLTKSDWASWVQAFGSIAAIIGAFILGERQAQIAHRNNLKLQEDERRRRQGAMLAIVQAVGARASEIGGVYKPKYPATFDIFMFYDAKVLQDLIDALSAIPLHEIGSYEAVTAFLEVKNRFIYLKRGLDSDFQFLESASAKGEDEWNPVREHNVDHIRLSCNVVEEYCRYFERMLGFGQTEPAGPQT